MSEEQPDSSPSSSSSSAFSIDLPHASAAAGVYTHENLAAAAAAAGAAGSYTTDQATASYPLYGMNPSGFEPDEPIIDLPHASAAAGVYTHADLAAAAAAESYTTDQATSSYPLYGMNPSGSGLLYPPPVQQPGGPSRMTMRTLPLPMFALDKTIDGEVEHLRRLNDTQRYDQGEHLEHILSDLVPQCVKDEDKVQRGEAADRDKDRDPTPDSRYISTERAGRRDRQRDLSRER
eukprot:Cvel_24132.t1-p1 / transcript=Cvel_24132.t1 / gene=Cvel_24132 / organism=Chromera_velia_CCMP2878 / gene_product=hypothetical protein / transcript_product=hypothetical protein / location=Cvel_scaffold2574:1-701(-) / protein_length=233 / sequence_SO=supercontig / SO=protein_coding / is_pseudo=false